MERRKDSEDLQDDASTMDTDGKIMFKKQNNQRQKPSFNKSVSLRKQIESTSTDSHESESSDKPTLKGSKVIMPEYVIGQKVSSSKTKKTKLSSSSSSSTTQTGDTKSSKQNQKPLLQHLFDEEQDEDEDDSERMDDD